MGINKKKPGGVHHINHAGWYRLELYGFKQRGVMSPGVATDHTPGKLKQSNVLQSANECHMTI